MALECALVAPDPGTDRADPMTRVLARRVFALRKGAGMNQGELGARMAELRPNWSRSTVVKLENYKREAVGVADLLALAVVLDVPPVWLLADPRSSEPVPVTTGVELDPWSALLWMVGREPLDDVPGSRFAEARSALVELQRLAQGLAAIRSTEDSRAGGGGLPEEDRPAEDERLIEALQRPLELLTSWGYPTPPIPERVTARAAELGVKLPGVEG